MAAIAQWNLDETSGGTATDSVGSNDGTLVNFTADEATTDGAAANTGSAFDLNGTDEYIDCGTGLSLPAAGSISFWSDSFATGNRSYVAKGLNNQVQVFHESSNLKLRVGAGTSDLNYGAAIAAGWHHVVATWDSGTGFLYIDGAQIATGSVNSTPSNSGSQRWWIGQFGSGSPIGGYYLNGGIDQVRIHNSALSLSEVESLYSGDLSSSVNALRSHQQLLKPVDR